MKILVKFFTNTSEGVRYLERFMFPVCNVTTDVKSVAVISQRICQGFKTRKQEILNTYFIMANNYRGQIKSITFTIE